MKRGQLYLQPEWRAYGIELILACETNVFDSQKETYH